MRGFVPLTGLRAFEAAARHLSFKAAAEELRVTPTAISHQIRLLEQHCGIPLFRRRPQPLALTDAGAKLFPVVRDGLDRFEIELASLRDDALSGRLRVTATNAFAARWLIPRLPLWRERYPLLPLDIVGTDVRLDLVAGEADIAIRYARVSPREGPSVELARDTFYVVGSHALVANRTLPLSNAELAEFTRLDCDWDPSDAQAPTWKTWLALAGSPNVSAPALSNVVAVTFREELHLIEAVLAGQGIAICSDILVGEELRDGTVVRLSDLSLPGYGFQAVHRDGHPKTPLLRAFVSWMQELI